MITPAVCLLGPIRSDGTAQCRICRRTHRHVLPNHNIMCTAVMPKRSTRGEPTPEDGPGSRMTEVLTDMGYKKYNGCGCKVLAGWMNAWGPEGCRRPGRRALILEQLRNQASLEKVIGYDDSWGELLLEQVCLMAEGKWPCEDSSSTSSDDQIS